MDDVPFASFTTKSITAWRTWLTAFRRRADSVCVVPAGANGGVAVTLTTETSSVRAVSAPLTVALSSGAGVGVIRTLNPTGTSASWRSG